MMSLYLRYELTTRNLPNRREHRWRIVVDGVDSRSVLPQEQHATQEKSPLDLAVLSHRNERFPEPLAKGSLLFFKSGIQESDLLDNVEFVLR